MSSARPSSCPRWPRRPRSAPRSWPASAPACGRWTASSSSGASARATSLRWMRRPARSSSPGGGAPSSVPAAGRWGKHPYPMTPDEQLAPMKEQVYKDPRPAEHFTPYHERTRGRDPDWVYEVVRVVTTLWGYIAFRARCIGAENVPPAGPVIIAPNHFSFMDHFLAGMFIRRRIRFMAKSQLFSGPMQFIYTHGGVFPVRRGARDEEAFITAGIVLGRGGTIVMYLEAGRSRTGKISERARPGIGRLALETGAPIVPTAIFGSSKVRNWKRLKFPKVGVQYGEPLTFPVEAGAARERHQEVSDEIFGRIKELYAGLEQHGRRGIAEQLREKRRALRPA